jgi:hypothetical protein
MYWEREDGGDNHNIVMHCTVGIGGIRETRRKKVTTLEQGLLEEDVNRLCVSIAEQAGVRHQHGNDEIQKLGKETTKPRDSEGIQRDG